MGKVKVYELAKQLNMQNNEVVEKLNKMGVEVKSHLSTVEDDVVKTFLKTEVKKEPAKKEVAEKEHVHIIRRNVKVINTDGEKSEVEQITTNITGGIKKSHTVIDQSKDSSSYSKEGLGVITPRQNVNKNQNFNDRKNTNVVITRNGKSVNSLEKNTEEVKKDVNLNVEKEVVEKPKTDYSNEKTNVGFKENNITSNTNTNVNNNTNPRYNSNNQDRSFPQNRNNQENRNVNPNNQNSQSTEYRKPYNNQNSGNGYTPNRGYNNQNNNASGGQNRPAQTTGGGYNNRPVGGYTRENTPPGGYAKQPSTNAGYNNRPNNTTGGYNNNRPANTTGGYNNRPAGGYNRENTPAGGYNRPANTTGGYNNNRPNNNAGGYNNQNNNNTSYQVNKFMKQAATLPVEQKETREYNTDADKKKYTRIPPVEQKDKLDKNKLREEQSRISTTKLKGLEVKSPNELMDLYEREGDFSRKGNKRRNPKQRPSLNKTKIIPMTEVKLPEVMSVKEFAEAIKKQASDVIKKLFALGILATVNQEIDFDTAFLIAEEFGITAHKQVVVTHEDILFDDSEDEEKDLKPRAPVVVVMGHVDHGKTSLLDKIRCADVVACEAGGITQHIGAYKVTCNSREICFLDTPGHEAFTAMRARGAQITDIAIIIVAADDGIKPQTIEAIDHAKAAGVAIIVAINKIDKPTANVEKVKQDLLQVGLVAEEWGGDTICIPISASTGEGIDNLLEMILLVADMKNLRANPNKQAKGTIIEARLDKNIGTVISMLVQRGTLNVGDTIVVGDIIGKVRAMKDDKGNRVEAAGPSTPVEIIGLSKVPQTGDIFYEVENEKVAKHLVEKRKAKTRRDLIKEGTKVTLDDLFGQINEGKVRDLNVIIKADVQGSVEALKESLEKLSNSEVRVRILHASTGGIKQSDVTLASVSNSIIIGFNVRPEASVAAQVKKEKIDMRLYSVIYSAIDDVETALKGLMPKKYKEIMHGTAEVRKIFNITGSGIIAGCYVTKGKILRNSMVRLVRDSIVIFEIKIDSLKREKDDAKEVAEGYECGIKLENFTDIKEGDIFECFEMVEEKR